MKRINKKRENAFDKEINKSVLGPISRSAKYRRRSESSEERRPPVSHRSEIREDEEYDDNPDPNPRGHQINKSIKRFESMDKNRKHPKHYRASDLGTAIDSE